MTELTPLPCIRDKTEIRYEQDAEGLVELFELLIRTGNKTGAANLDALFITSVTYALQSARDLALKRLGGREKGRRGLNGRGKG